MTPKLKIYKRKNNWFGRVYIPKEYSDTNTKQEIYFSTGTDDYMRAEKILNEKYNDLFYQIRHGKFLGNLPLLNIINKFDDHILLEYELGRITKIYYNNYKSPIKAVKKFIEEKNIKKFEKKTLKIDYLNFRKLENPDIRNTSLHQEFNALRLVMRWAELNDLVGKNDLPEYPTLKKEDNRRTFFRPDEYKSLLKTSRSRFQEREVSEETRFLRERLHWWIVFMVGCGLRVSEAQHLKFGDIKEFTKNNIKQLEIAVREGKTGSRLVVSENSSYQAIIKLKQLYLKNGVRIDKSTNVFQTNTFSKSLNNLLEACDLKTDDRLNKKRDGKSFRQTYISWEIIKNKRNLHWIAKNCGNSIEVIQKNYANNLTQEDFFSEKINAIPIV